MERKYLANLLEWNSDEDRKPLLVLGARQVGKSYLIEELFAKEYYKNRYLRIDCSDDTDFVNFAMRNDSLDKVLDYIQIHYDFIPDANHLLIFDEAQECLPIIKMMKHFCERKRDIPLIVSGSLVRIKIHRHTHKRGGLADKGFLFPVGKINQLIVYPLTFDEFLLNYKKPTYDFLLEHYQNKKSIPTDLHQELLRIFNNYLFVGGMPESVQTFLRHKENPTIAYEKTSARIKEIYSNYLSDMELYQVSAESIMKSRLIFRNIFSQLNKENKNFKYSEINEKYRSRDVATPIEWLQTANIVNKAHLVKEHVTSPLIEDEDSLFRLYLSDVGLFTYQSGLNAKTFASSKDNALSGIYYENFVACELAARGIELFYWKGKQDSELEFLLNVDGEILPIDVKKTKGSLKSMQEFRSHNKRSTIIKVSANQYGYNEEHDILTIPYYFFSFFLNERF